MVDVQLAEKVIAYLKENRRIEDLLYEEYSIVVGKGAVSCPFHSDTSPSLHVDTAEQRYNCFACSTGGNYNNLYKDIQNSRGAKLNYYGAIEDLLNKDAQIIQDTGITTIMIRNGKRNLVPFKSEDFKRYKPVKKYNLNIIPENISIDEYIDHLYLLQLNGMGV